LFLTAGGLIALERSLAAAAQVEAYEPHQFEEWASVMR